MTEILIFVSLGIFRYEFPITIASFKELILKKVGGFYCFSLEIIKKSIVNKHYIFYYNKIFLALFSKLVHI